MQLRPKVWPLIRALFGLDCGIFWPECPISTVPGRGCDRDVAPGQSCTPVLTGCYIVIRILRYYTSAS